MSSKVQERYLVAAAIIGLAFAAPAFSASGNVDPRYNISCEPGTVVIWMSGDRNGLMFVCESSAFTRALELYNLKEDAVVGESPVLAILGWAGWALNMFFDETLRVERYRNYIAAYEADAAEYTEKANQYWEMAVDSDYSNRQREKYRKKAQDYEKKADKATAKAEKYRSKIYDIANRLDRSMPDGISVRVTE